jgi:uncharacterized protein
LRPSLARIAQPCDRPAVMPSGAPAVSGAYFRRTGVCLPTPAGARRMQFMRRLDPQTEVAVRTFLARVPPELKVEKAIVFGSRARGDNRADSDADLALVFERGNEWSIVGLLAGLAFDVLMETGILVQPVPISTSHWTHPEEFPRPGFLRAVAREGIAV